MYLSFYHLKHKPFQISTDPKFLWLGAKHEEALATLRYGVLDNKGFLLLTGDVGTGKTTLINALLKTLDLNTLVAFIRDPALDPLDFFQYTAHAFGMKASNINSKGAFLIQFEEFLMEAYKKKRKVLLIIDEAQMISQKLLEEVRLLSNIERDESKLLNIFFVGQLEFNGILSRPENRAIRQRITINFNVEPLTKQETGKYIRHRLDVASTDDSNGFFSPLEKEKDGQYVKQRVRLPLPRVKDDIFTNNAIREVYAFSKGYPRLINIICDRALLTGFVEESKTIKLNHIKECVKELEIPNIGEFTAEPSPPDHSNRAPQKNVAAEKPEEDSPQPVKAEQHIETADSSYQPTTEDPIVEDDADNSEPEYTFREMLDELARVSAIEEPEESNSPINTPIDATVQTTNEQKKKKRHNKTVLILASICAALAAGYYYMQYVSDNPNLKLDSITSYFQKQLQPGSKAPEATPNKEAAEQTPAPAQVKSETVNTASPTPVEVAETAKPPENKANAAADTPEKVSMPPEQQIENTNSSSLIPQETKIAPKISPKKEPPITQEISIADNPAKIKPNNDQDTTTIKLRQLRSLITFEKITIPFPANSNLPPVNSLEKLNSLVDSLLAHPSFKVTVTYFADSRNDETMTNKLSEFQANAVKSYLMGRGLGNDRIIIKKSETSATPPNLDEAGTTAERWVEIEINK